MSASVDKLPFLIICFYAAEGNKPLAEIVTAILPCSWCYEEIGEFMEKDATEEAKKSPVFGPWIAMYTDPGFRQMNDELIAMLDRFSEGYTEERIQNLEKIIVNSSNYERLFWEASWKMGIKSL